ncbi:catechol 1,2-dioxygenase [Streptomyces bingchenggensis BCW-1]|uniref:Catechol 1,2-dioxygenase n=1 Tax=Streptomyces bingchenggensis (strain BCW-1) TaxID=749414 RepID=D7CBD3_STRBB|nr:MULTISPECIES: catechol 1,2-dioxygenase [Streptomyces]ADI12810.1 catechol 1,2-dioxygenase [Streptomyces bingchenggensis BCW-1]
MSDATAKAAVKATAAATAAASGASATERFLTDKTGTSAPGADTERVHILATEMISAVHDIVRRHQVTYEEYNALKSWLISVGRDGEWPLFLDVWVEHVVEEVATAARQGSKGTIEGPYYVPGAPELPSVSILPMRDKEAGTELLFQGRVTSASGEPLAGARLEMWQADGEGLYAQFAPGIPEWNLRGSVVADDEGRFAVTTIQPAPYQIPTDGSCGRLISAAGWHAWRPAHLHLKVSAPGHTTLTTQLYFKGGTYVEDDVARAVKPELVIDPRPTGDGGCEVTHGFVLDPAS